MASGIPGVFLCIGAFMSAWAGSAVPSSQPPVAHADTETVTNIPFTAVLDASFETFSVSVTPDGTVFIMR